MLMLVCLSWIMYTRKMAYTRIYMCVLQSVMHTSPKGERRVDCEAVRVGGGGASRAVRLAR